MVLSIIICEGFRKPFSALGEIRTHNKGEATSVLNTGSMVM